MDSKDVLNLHAELLRLTSETDLLQKRITACILLATHPYPISKGAKESIESIGFKYRPWEIFGGTSSHTALKCALAYIQVKSPAYAKVACTTLGISHKDLTKDLPLTVLRVKEEYYKGKVGFIPYTGAMSLLDDVVNSDTLFGEELTLKIKTEMSELREAATITAVKSSDLHKTFLSQGKMTPLLEDFLYRTTVDESDRLMLEKHLAHRQLLKVPQEEYAVTLEMAYIIYRYISTRFEEEDMRKLVKKFKALPLRNTMEAYKQNEGIGHAMLKIASNITQSRATGLFTETEQRDFTMLLNKMELAMIN